MAGVCPLLRDLQPAASHAARDARQRALDRHQPVGVRRGKVSLSDRFGLWIGFHHCSQGDYLEMVRAYAGHYRLEIPEAADWALARGSRSGRVAWQYIQDLAGRLGTPL